MFGGAWRVTMDSWCFKAVRELNRLPEFDRIHLWYQNMSKEYTPDLTKHTPNPGKHTPIVCLNVALDAGYMFGMYLIWTCEVYVYFIHVDVKPCASWVSRLHP